MDIVFRFGNLSTEEQKLVTAGFAAHTDEQSAQHYNKESVNWIAHDDAGETTGVLVADVLWDWMYIDELWVSPMHRGEGLGSKLMDLAQEFAIDRRLQGVWLWTQSWQGERFYQALGYTEFTRFDDFPKGHSRIGFRKSLT